MPPPASEEEPAESAGQADRRPDGDDAVERDGSSGGVVEESNSDSVRAQVSLLESLFGRADAESCRAAGGRSGKAGGAGARMHAKQASAAVNSARAKDENVAANVARCGDGAAEAADNAGTVAAGKNDSPKEDRAQTSEPVLPEFEEDDVPEMEETYEIAKLAHALFQYSPHEDDELGLAAGEAVYVLGVSQPDWLVAVKAGTAPAAIGLVPENYIKIASPCQEPRSEVAEGEQGDGNSSQPAVSSADSSPLPTPKFDAAVMSQLESTASGRQDVATEPDYLDTPTGPPIFSRSATFALAEGIGRNDSVGMPSLRAENAATNAGRIDSTKEESAVGVRVSDAASYGAPATDVASACSSSPTSSSAESADIDDLMEDMYSASGVQRGAAAAPKMPSVSAGAAALSPRATVACSASSSTSGPVAVAEGCPAFDEEDLPEMEERYDDVKMAKALYNYSAQEDDELTVQAGDRLFVIGLSQPDWLVAVKADRSVSGTMASAPTGLIPENYIALQL